MPDPTPDDERSERAFRDAFTRYADDLKPVVLESPVVRRRRGRTLAAVAAAAAVVVATVGVTAILRSDEIGPNTPAAGPTGSVSTPQAADVRTVSFLDVAVEVPASWRDAYAPTDQWCVGEKDFPTEPYVALDGSTRPSTDVGCFGEEAKAPTGFPPVPVRFWAPHLSLLPAGLPQNHQTDGVVRFEDWTLTTRTVGAVRLEILTDPATIGLVDEILDSARARDTDDNGCDTTSPAQSVQFVRPPAFDVGAIDTVTDIAVCQYGRQHVTGLLASRLLRGAAAQDELEAIQAAPTGGGPDHPANCVDDYFGDQAIVLRLHDGDRALGDLYVYYDWCFGNGIDDGTTRRTLTVENCSPLWGKPVFQYSGDGRTFEVCHPDNTPS